MRLINFSLCFHIQNITFIILIMAEALVAVGLAANILQFIDVGSRFISNAWNICASGRQGLADLLDVQKTTEDLKNVLLSFLTSNEASATLDNNESGLQQLVRNCERLANELLDSLHKIHLSEKSRKRDVLRTAFKMIWKEEELKSLQLRLNGFRQELVLHLLSLIRYVPRWGLPWHFPRLSAEIDY